MIDLFIVILSVIFITGIGFSVIKWLKLLSGKDNLLTLGYSYGLGVGLISFQLYLYSRLNVSWDKYLLIVPWGLLMILFAFLNKKRFKFNFKIPKLGKIQYSLLALILLAVSYTLLEALLRPVSVWDAWAIWLMKSKVFFIDGKIMPSTLNYVRSDYPLVIGLLGTFIYLMLGKVNDTVVLFASFSFYLFLGILFFGIIKERFGITYALLATFLLLAVQNLIRHGGRLEVGQADLALGYYFFICLSLLLSYLKNNNFKILILLSVFMGITTLIKFEGIPFVLVLEAVILYRIFTKKLYQHLISMLLWIIPVVDWQMYKMTNHFIYTYFSGRPIVVSTSKTINAFWITFLELINVKSWNLLWITYLYSLFTFKIFRNREFIIVNFMVLSQLAVYILIYILTLNNAPESTIERLLTHLAPMAMLYLVLLAAEKNLKTKINRSILFRHLRWKV